MQRPDGRFPATRRENPPHPAGPLLCWEQLMRSGTSVIILGKGAREAGSGGTNGFLAETKCQRPSNGGDTISICLPFSLFKFLPPPRPLTQDN